MQLECFSKAEKLETQLIINKGNQAGHGFGKRAKLSSNMEES